MENEFYSERIDYEKKNRKFKEDTKRFNDITNNTIKCKCGHSVLINSDTNRVLCSWCNNYVFKSKEDEFKYRLKERLR